MKWKNERVVRGFVCTSTEEENKSSPFFHQQRALDASDDEARTANESTKKNVDNGMLPYMK